MMPNFPETLRKASFDASDNLTKQLLSDAADAIEEMECNATGWRDKWKASADAHDELWRKACLWKEDSNLLMEIAKRKTNEIRDQSH